MTKRKDEELFKVPQAGDRDVLYAAGEALSNIIPFAGPELFRLVFASPLESRRNKWMEEVSKGLLALHNSHKVDINNLAQNEEFVSLAAETTKAALAQHQNEKLQYLRNALLNSLLLDIDYDIKFVFLKAVEQLTPRHIQALKYIRGKAPNNPNSLAFYEDIVKGLAVNHFNDTEEVAKVFFNDLLQLKLIDKQPLQLKHDGLLTEHYFFNGWGESFINFIEDPEL